MFGFHATQLAWLALAAIPLTAVYFLKLKRPRMEVPSLVLWQQVMQDQRVNAPFQRFRRNLLLLFQLLALLFLVLAAMQPFLRGDVSPSAKREVWIVDASASMGATGAEGDDTVLDEVKQNLIDRIEAIKPGEERALILFESAATELSSFTGNKARLKQAVQSIQVRDLPSNLVPALRMAEALSKRAGFGHAVVFTDGNLPTRIPFDLPFGLQLENFAHETSANIGVTTLSAQRLGPGQWELLARVEHCHENETTARAVWTSENGTREEVIRLAKGPVQLRHQVRGGSQLVHFELFPFDRDDLRSDNKASLDLPEARTLQVAVDTNLPFFVHAFEVMPDVSLNQTDPSQADLMISSASDIPTSVPVALQVGVFPSALTNVLYEVDAAGEVIDWRRDHRLLYHVNLQELSYYGAPGYQPGRYEAALEDAGYRAIVHGQQGPLLLEQPNLGGLLRYQMLLPVRRSMLPQRLAFPILLANLAEQTREMIGLSRVEAVSTGSMPDLYLAANQTIDLHTPDMRRLRKQAREDGMVPGLSATLTGRYTIKDSAGDILREFHAGLLNRLETSLHSVDQLQFNQIEIENERREGREDKPLWRWLLGLAFLFLLIEWRHAHRSRKGFILRDQMSS